MTFLNGLFLIALPLIAVPLVLHFLRRRERKIVQWGAMQFLQEATTDSRRMKLPESLLLLLTRCLLVAGLSLALARPLINWGSSNAIVDRELIVIVDDSLSTARRSDGSPVFDRIRDSAEEVISSSAANLPFQLMFASGGGSWVGDRPQGANTFSGKAALAELAQHKPTMGQADLIGCIRKAMSAANDRETSTRPRPAQRIVVVTDGTTPAWLDADQLSLGRLRSAIEQSKLPVQIQVVEIDQPVGLFSNLSVVNVDSETDRVAVKETVRLSAEIRNTGSTESESCRLVWSVNDKVLGHSGVPDLEPGQSTKVFWSTRFKKAGPVAVVGDLELDQSDHLPEDSRSVKVVDVVEKIPILVIDNQSLSGIANLQSQQIAFFTSALGYQGEEAGEKYHSFFAPTIVSASDVISEDLSAYSVIVVLGTSNDSPELAELLVPEVQRGCGVWLFVSPEPDIQAFNMNWFLDGSGLSPLALVEAPTETQATEDGADQPEVRIHPPSAQHPATRVLSDQQRIDLDQVTVQQHAWFQPLLIGDEVSVPLRSNRGQPLVIENAMGQGRVLVQSFPISMDATNLAVTNSFVVMVHEWLDYLAKPSGTTLNLSVGAPLVWRYEDRNQRPAALELPDGSKIDLTDDAARYGVDQSAGTFRFFATRMPGLYRARNSARSDSPIEVPFYVAPSRDELLAQTVSQEQRTWLTDVGKFDVASTSGELSTKAKEFWNRQKDLVSTVGGQPIWHWIILGLIALLIFELVLAGRVGRQRGGVHVSADQQLQSINELVGRSATGGSGELKNETKNREGSRSRRTSGILS